MFIYLTGIFLNVKATPGTTLDLLVAVSLCLLCAQEHLKAVSI